MSATAVDKRHARTIQILCVDKTNGGQYTIGQQIICDRSPQILFQPPRTYFEYSRQKNILYQVKQNKLFGAKLQARRNEIIGLN